LISTTVPSEAGVSKIVMKDCNIINLCAPKPEPPPLVTALGYVAKGVHYLREIIGGAGVFVLCRLAPQGREICSPPAANGPSPSASLP
jgi:hypothetical protein